jgi:hypothetical protein
MDLKNLAQGAAKLAKEVDKVDTSSLPLSADKKKKVDDVKNVISGLAKKL